MELSAKNMLMLALVLAIAAYVTWVIVMFTVSMTVDGSYYMSMLIANLAVMIFSLAYLFLYKCKLYKKIPALLTLLASGYLSGISTYYMIPSQQIHIGVGRRSIL